MTASHETVYCLRHRDRETVLRCARCGDPICPECMVQGAVAHLCPSCVTWERNPVAQVAGSRLVLAIGAGLGAGLLLAIVIGVLTQVFGGFLSIIMWAVAGYLIGMAVHTAANRSRAPTLRYVAGGSAAFAWTAALFFDLLVTGGLALSVIWIVFALIEMAIAITLAISPFR